MLKLKYAKTYTYFHCSFLDNFLHFLKHQTERMYNFIQHRPLNDTIVDFANSIVHRGNSSVLEQMNQIRTMLAFQTENRVADYFMDTYSNYLERSPKNRLCHLTTSPQQTMFDLLRKLYYAEVTALELIGYGYAVKVELSEKEQTFESEKKLAENDFKEYSSMIQSLMQYYLPRLERTYWRCDAKTWQRDVTFHELNRMIHGVVEYEYDLGDSCGHTCGTFNVRSSHTRMDMWPEHKCSGYVSSCESTSSGQFEFCFSNSEVSLVKYSYISNDVMKRGSKEDCQSRPMHKVSLMEMRCGKIEKILFFTW
jgi:uncharacterized cupin superfamily protein